MKENIIKFFKKNILIIFLLTFPFNILAVMVHLPVVTDSERHSDGTGRWTISPVVLYVPELEANRTMNGNEGFSIAYIYINRNPKSGFLVSAGASELGVKFPLASAGETFLDYANRVYANGNMNLIATSTTLGGLNEKDCVGIHLNTEVITSSGTTAQEAFGNLLPYATYAWQTMCSQLPPSNVNCEIENDELSFDFGVLVQNNAIGKTATAEVSLKCSDTVSVKLLDMTGGRVSLTNGGKVSLTDGGVLLGPESPIHTVSSDGSNSFPIVATMIEPGSAGDFSGHSIITLSYP